MKYDELKHSVSVLLKQLQEYQAVPEPGFANFFVEIQPILRNLLSKRFLHHVSDERTSVQVNNQLHNETHILLGEYKNILSLKQM
jgi:hypothetical protein